MPAPRKPWRPPGWEPIPDEPWRFDGLTRDEHHERSWAQTKERRAALRAAFDPTDSPYADNNRRRAFDKTIREAYPVTEGRMPNPRFLPDAQLIELVERLAKNDRYDWLANARPEQIEPENYRTWLLKAGRGFGKTRTGAETVRIWCKVPKQRIAVVAKASRELRDFCFEGVSGLNNVFEPHEIKTYRKGLGDCRLELVNGSVIHGYSAGEPDAIRGGSYMGAWCVAEGELILTRRGQVPVQDVRVGDRVMTRKGWRRVRRAGKTGRQQVFRVTTEDGHSVRLTGDHLVWTEGRGFVEVGNLSVREDTLLAWTT